MTEVTQHAHTVSLKLWSRISFVPSTNTHGVPTTCQAGLELGGAGGGSWGQGSDTGPAPSEHLYKLHMLPTCPTLALVLGQGSWVNTTKFCSHEV